MKILMRGFVHQVVLESLADTFTEHTFYLTNRIYHPNYPPEYFPPIPKNVRKIPKISDLEELDNYDIFIGIFGGEDMKETYNWKIPTVWRTYVPISMNWKYLRKAPLVYNAFESKRVTVQASKNCNRYGSHIEGSVTYDYRDPNVFKNWNGKIPEAIIIGKPERGIGYGKDLYEEVSKKVPVRLIKNVPYSELLEIFKNYRVYLEVTRTYRIMSASISEAMVTGMPVITNQVGEFQFLINHGIDGFIVSNSKKMIEYSSLFIKDRNLAERIGRKGRVKALRLFSKDKVRNAFEKAFFYAFNGKWEK